MLEIAEGDTVGESHRRNGWVTATVALNERAHYRIRVRGILPRGWSSWFSNFTITPEANDHTTLTGPVTDQATLHGVISRIRDLGLTLIAVERIDPE